MEYLIICIILICINELREWRTTQKYTKIIQELKELNVSYLSMVHTSNAKLEKLIDQSKRLGELSHSVQSLHAKLDQSEKFIEQAQTDLETIVKEYKINGIPLGYQRKNIEENYHIVEGI